MEYFVEQASSHREAEQKVRAKYGEQARIMHHRTVRVGGILGLFSREAVEVTGYFASAAAKRADTRQAPSQASGAQQRSFEEEKRKLLETARGGDKTMETLLAEIRSIKEAIGPAEAASAHPMITEIQELLEQNDFAPSYVRKLIVRAKKELSMEALSDRDLVHARVLEWIGESMHFHQPRKGGSPELFILVGPTGVGKTTTIAKLAAMYGLDRNQKARDIRVLTIDNYRIGARQQIETYGQIMDIPVSFVESAEDMKKYLALYQDADMIFVDTIGKSPRDFKKLGEMNELLSLCGGRARVHLAVSATTKAADVSEILTQFEPFKYEAVVITKLDETMRVGNIISALSEREKPLSFVTDGQRVPQDIERATPMRFLKNIEGFSVPRAQLEKRFSVA